MSSKFSRDNKTNINMMSIAQSVGQLSSCNKRKVGCIIVSNNKQITIGYNGTAPGQCNDCEDSNGNTLDTVIHAEANAISKLDHCDQSTLYVTYAPCDRCADLIIASNISSVYYHISNKKSCGLSKLIANDISVCKIN